LLTEAGKGWDFDEIRKCPKNTKVSMDIYNYIMREEVDVVHYLRKADGSEMSALEKSDSIHEKIRRYFNNLRHLKAKEDTGIEEASKAAASTRNRRRTRKHYVSTRNSSVLFRHLRLFMC